jgi:hypothetical protein
VDTSLASWLVIAVAIAFANLPFLNENVFGVLPLEFARGRSHAKYFVVRLLELAVSYVLVGALARFLESRIGNVFDQTWEFYWSAAFLFLVLAFPGFVFRYLRKRRA